MNCEEVNFNGQEESMVFAQLKLWINGYSGSKCYVILLWFIETLTTHAECITLLISSKLGHLFFKATQVSVICLTVSWTEDNIEDVIFPLNNILNVPLTDVRRWYDFLEPLCALKNGLKASYTLRNFMTM